MRTEKLFFWLSIAFGVLTAVIACLPAISAPYVVQDDARQHIFWMEQFRDPGLFPHDLIADYFRSVAPAGYTLFYRAGAALGISPLAFAKMVPILLSALCAYFGYRLALQLFGQPLYAFFATAVLISNLWLLDALSNATPRAFGYPLFLAFSYYLVARSSAGVAGSVFLLGLFYPGLAILSGAMLAASLIGGRDRKSWVIFFAGAVAVAIAVLPYGLAHSRYGPVLDAAGAHHMPELMPGGRSQFFADNPFAYYFCGERSGAIPLEWCWAGKLSGTMFVPPLLALLFLGTLAWPLFALRRRSELAFFPRLIGASIAVFVLAHALLFRLHLPSRYAQPSLRIAFDLAFGALLAHLLMRIFRAHRGAVWAASALFFIIPFAENKVAWRGWVQGRHPALYAFLARQPKDLVVASLDAEADNLSSFAQRTVLVSHEHAIPYHLGYFRALEQKREDVAAAEATRDPQILASIIDRYQIDYWLIGQDALRALPESMLHAREAPCRVFRDGELVLIDAHCLAGENDAVANLRSSRRR